MAIDERKWTPCPISTGTEPFKDERGTISLGTIIILFMLIAVAGLIFYRLFSTDKKNQLALGNSSSSVSEPHHYRISPPPSATVDDNNTAQQSNDEMLPSLSRSADDTLVPADVGDTHTTEKVEPGTGLKEDISETVGNASFSSGEDTDEGDIADTNPDSRPGPLEPTIPGEATAPPPRELETLYMKVPVGRVRKAPSMDADIFFYLKKSDRVSVLDTRDGWYLIEATDGRKGWAHGMLFSMDAPQRQAGADNNLIRAILVETPGPNRRAVHIVLSDYHLPRTMVLEGERPRVVCDFYGLHLSSGIKKEVEYGTGLVRAVRVGTHLGENPKIRIVVDLVPEHDYIVEQRFILEENVYLLDIRLK
jgi:hypothetical protein